MLLVGTPKAKKFVEQINGMTLNGVTFKVESVSGLNTILSYDTDDETAKQMIKEFLKNNSEFSRGFSSVKKCDAKGAIY